MKKVTANEWADFLCQFRCFATEPHVREMAHQHWDTGERLGLVQYHADGTQDYYIKEHPTSPTKNAPGQGYGLPLLIPANASPLEKQRAIKEAMERENLR